jgi:hypothetical protein
MTLVCTNRSCAMNLKSNADPLGATATSLRNVISFRALAGRWSASDIVVLTKPRVTNLQMER